MIFSVITVTRNNLDGLKRTAQSLQAQSWQDYEWVVIDGASTDGTPAYLSALNDSRLSYISEPDNGIYEAMNKGTVKAQGDYLLFMNAGDTLANETILSRMATLTITQPDFIYGDSQENGFYKKARSHNHIHYGMFTHHQAMLYRRNTWNDLRYDTNYKIAADYDATLRFLQRAAQAAYVPFAVCDFEPGGISQRDVKTGRKEQFLSRRRNKVLSLPMNVSIYLAQMLAYQLRRHMPGLYWALKAR